MPKHPKRLYKLGELLTNKCHQRETQVKQLRREWDKSVWFRCGSDEERKEELNECNETIHNIYMVNETIMPYMIYTPATMTTLSTDLLFAMRDVTVYSKLTNFLSLASAQTGSLLEVMFPSWMQGQIIRMAGLPSANQFTAAILVSCGPTILQVSMGVHSSELFGLNAITFEQSYKARQWLRGHWCFMDVHTRMNLDVAPLVDTRMWWKFVRRYMRSTFGFGLTHRKQDNVYLLVANDVWKLHSIDVAQVGLAHRLRTQQQLSQGVESYIDVPLQYNGRPYGVLPVRVCQCTSCPISRGATSCVRQNGSEWLCCRSDPEIGLNVAHRQHAVPVDTGYLDE
jgi:hypothetical protein